MKALKVVFVLGAMVCGWCGPGDAFQGSSGPAVSAPGGASLPAPFLIARMPYNSMTGLVAVVHNPVSDRYVAFIQVTYSPRLSRLFTRVFESDGAPAGGLRMAFELATYIQTVDVAYNAKDDRFLVVAGYGGIKTMFDGIKAGVFDGQGRLLPDQPLIEIKEETGPFSGLFPHAAWVAETNQYAVSWSSWNYAKLTDPANGHYLAVLNSDLSFKIQGKQVRQQTIKREEPFIASICPVGDTLLWGSSETVGPNWVKPVAWFTSLNGTLLTDYGYDGILSPGPMVKARASVAAVYDPDHDRILLRWNVADHPYLEKQTFCKNFFRVMDDQGIFKSGMTTLPKKTAFQDSGIAVYNSREGRFFFVAPEFRVVGHGGLWNYGMKLRGFYVNPLGKIEDKAGNVLVIGYDLTTAILDPHKSSDLEALAYDPGTNSYFIGYGVSDEYAKTVDLMGIIYK
jgi:hypothetical protein